MGTPVNHSDSATRQQLLHAALKCFAEKGYAATSVQEIVDAAEVSKPVLYYYFSDKEAIFEAVLQAANEERYRLMQAAAEKGNTVAEKLELVLAAIFEYSLRNRELMRLTFATAFAFSPEFPGQRKCCEKGRRNFEFVRSLIERGQACGELTSDFSAEELTMGIYGQLNSYVMVRLLVPDCPLNADSARQIVALFLRGAANRAQGNGHARGPKRLTKGSRIPRNHRQRS